MRRSLPAVNRASNRPGNEAPPGRLALRHRLAWRVGPATIRVVARLMWRLRVEHEAPFPEPPFIIAANSAGRMIGNVIRRAICKFVDPATRADSSKDGSME